MVAPLPETSIESAAARIDSIEQAQPYHPAGTSTFGHGFAERLDLVNHFRPPAATATLRNYHLDSVHFVPASMTLIKDGLKIKETNYMVTLNSYNAACIMEDRLIRLDAGINYIMARAYDNYYHWLIQTIPALDWSLKNLPPAKFALFSGQMTKWHMEMLSLLRYDRVPRIAIDPNHQYFVPSIDYCEFQNGRTGEEVSPTAQAVYKRLKDAAIDPSPAEADIIYVARTDTSFRVLRNEAELIKLLEAEGVSIVVPGRLSVTQQINLFAKANAVIGPHGAGLSNIVFCRPATIFYELLQMHYFNPCFTRLAQAAGLHYTVDLFASETDPNIDIHQRGWLADLDLVLGRVREIKQRIVSLRPRPVSMPRPVSAMDYLKGLGSYPAPKITQEPGIQPSRKRSWLSRLFWRSTNQTLENPGPPL
jgi:hypothetical protein